MGVFFALFTLLIHTCSFIIQPVHAEGEFETKYDVTYEIDQSGKTHVTQNIQLTNKTANFYADKFELKIGSTKVVDVSATDNTGTLPVEVKEDNDLTTIAVKFNQKVIGSGKSLSWQLNYTSGELASKSGQIWEVSIPRLAKSADIAEYNAKIRVPRTFGAVAFAAPKPASQSQVAANQEFTFNRDQLTESGIAMSFGTKQVFSFKLNYYLENSNITSQTEEIPLPPDNNYQQIVLEKLDPKPVDVTVDADGNFLAKYKLSPKQNINITAEGFVEVFSKPYRNIYKPLTDKEKEIYTQPQQYWERDTGVIKDKAAELKTPDKIYEFVASYLKYSDERLNSVKIERKGAAAAYSNPTDAVCMEFTDLFIAIARAAGIPAREVQGYAYTQNERLRPLSLSLNRGDILHAWPEYWDDAKGWIQVDPTWGSTSGGLNYFEKLDFNHITFVERGISSTTPAPAGAYKKPDEQNKKTVTVEFAQDLPQPTKNTQISLSNLQKLIAAIPSKIDANVKNAGSTTIFSQKLKLSAPALKFSSPDEYEVQILPPFADRTFTFRVSASNLFEKKKENLILSFFETQITKPILIEPFYALVFSPMLLLVAFLIAFIAVAGLFSFNKIKKRSRRAKPPSA